LAPVDGVDRRPLENHRYDLDGLRGLAIALVVVFHVWFGRVSGGVDVFLVLSGFFFGGRILRSALASQSSLRPVAEVLRLVRRLVPAMVVVLAGSAVLTILIQPETRWEAFAAQSLASLGYYQNWTLVAGASDYLRAGEAVSPLQHLWSMSVQGQFYLTFLLLILGFVVVFRRVLGRHLRAGVVLLLGALAVVSFVVAIVEHGASQSAAYYDSFARTWELLMGVLVGAVVPYVRWPTWLRTTLGLLALAAILSCGLFIDGANEFPGPWALFPVGATVVLVLAGANRLANPRTADQVPMATRLLASGPLVALGSMAYSLYLWHWPLLIFWLSWSGRSEVTVFDGAVIVTVSGLLAYLTTRFIENPLRLHAGRSVRPSEVRSLRSRLRRPTIVLGSAVALLGVTLTATSFTWREYVETERAGGKELSGLSSRDYPGARALVNGARVPRLPMRPSVLEASNDLPDTTMAGCISDFKNSALITCTYGDAAAPRTIALAGGSHAEHWIPALDLLGRQHGVKVVTYLKMGCPLTTEDVPLIMGNNAPYPQCRDWVRNLLPRLIADQPDYVFTTSTRPWNVRPGDVMPSGYLGIWAALSQANIPILAMRDTPWMVRDGKPFAPADCLANGGDAVSCGIPRSQVLSDRNPTLAYQARFPMLKPLDMSEAVCRADVCRAVEGNVLIYRDSHHLSATYVRTLTDELGRQIGRATGWW
jgi:peptidoglycan/LPS O-acetylase OafA/YrhL